MSDSLKTIRTFGNLIEAELVKSVLDSEGIDCNLLDDQVGALVAMRGAAAVRLQVRAEDAEWAEEILAREPVGEADMDEAYEASRNTAGEDGFVDGDQRQILCPACGSDLVDYARLGLAKIIISIPLLGLPLFFMDPGRVCRSCKHEFSLRDQGII